jgi:hypothetical protein
MSEQSCGLTDTIIIILTVCIGVGGVVWFIFRSEAVEGDPAKNKVDKREYL